MDKEYFKILIEKYLDGNASTAEVRELCEWIKNNDSLDRWIMQAIERSDSHLDEEVYERLYTRIKENIESREKKSHRRFSFVPMLRWAAVVCLPIIAALAVYELGLDSKVDTLPLVVTAESGERAKVQLPDGTKVNINSASQISYPHDFNGEKRIVELDGEAYFEVNPDKERPFVVKAAGLEITVLGTAFDVCAYKDDNEVSVVLLTGKVDVASESDMSCSPTRNWCMTETREPCRSVRFIRRNMSNGPMGIYVSKMNRWKISLRFYLVYIT